MNDYDMETGEVISEQAGSALTVVEQQTRGEVDTQIATAKKYPRQIKSFLSEARSLVTLNEQVASSCIYAIPRDGKTIEGPSARFAEMVASCWGHMRAGSQVVDIDDAFVTVRGFAWDVQRNVAVNFEVRRRITNKFGKRYSDDMIGVTAAAAGSIAYRNAVLKVVPAAFWKPLYDEARTVAVGDARTLVDRRTAALNELAKMGVREERVFHALQIKGVEDIDLDKLAILRGMFTSIKDEGADIDSVFPDPNSIPKDQASRLKMAVDAAVPQKAEPASPEITKRQKQIREELAQVKVTRPEWPMEMSKNPGNPAYWVRKIEDAIQHKLGERNKEIDAATVRRNFEKAKKLPAPGELSPQIAVSEYQKALAEISDEATGIEAYIG